MLAVVDWTAIAGIISSGVVGLAGVGLAGWRYWDTNRWSQRKLLREHAHTMLTESNTAMVLADQLQSEVDTASPEMALLTMTEFRGSVLAIARAKSFLELLLGDYGNDLLIAGSDLYGECSSLALAAADKQRDLNAAKIRVTDARTRFRRLVLDEQEVSWRDRRRKKEAITEQRRQLPS